MRLLGGGPEGAVFLQPLADGPVHADVVVHGMSLDCDWVRSWTGHGLTGFADLAWMPCGLKRGYRRDIAWTLPGHRSTVAWQAPG